MTEERRAALRARAERSVESWDRDTKRRGQDELDLLAALERAEAVAEAAARYVHAEGTMMAYYAAGEDMAAGECRTLEDAVDEVLSALRAAVARWETNQP